MIASRYGNANSMAAARLSSGKMSGIVTSVLCMVMAKFNAQIVQDMSAMMDCLNISQAKLVKLPVTAHLNICSFVRMRLRACRSETAKRESIPITH